MTIESVGAEIGEIMTLPMRRSAELGELFTALAKAHVSFEPATKDGKNPHFNSKYATLDSAISATRGGLAANGLAIIQMPGNYGDNISVTTLLGHSSGQWIESTVYVAPVKFDAQATGSVITYLRRYARMAMTDIAGEDDDGEAAIAPPLSKTRQSQRKHAGPFSTAPKIDAEAPAQFSDEPLLQEARTAARSGTHAFGAFYFALSDEKRLMVRPHIRQLQDTARQADKEKDMQQNPTESSPVGAPSG